MALARLYLIDALSWVHAVLADGGRQVAVGLPDEAAPRAERVLTRACRGLDDFAGSITEIAEHTPRAVATLERIADALETIASAQRLAHGPRRVPDKKEA